MLDYIIRIELELILKIVFWLVYVYTVNAKYLSKLPKTNQTHSLGSQTRSGCLPVLRLILEQRWSSVNVFGNMTFRWTCVDEFGLLLVGRLLGQYLGRLLGQER